MTDKPVDFVGQTARREFYGSSDACISAEVVVDEAWEHPAAHVRLEMQHGLFTVTCDGEMPPFGAIGSDPVTFLTLSLRDRGDGEMNMTIDALRWCANQLERMQS